MILSLNTIKTTFPFWKRAPWEKSTKKREIKPSLLTYSKGTSSNGENNSNSSASSLWNRVEIRRCCPSKLSMVTFRLFYQSWLPMKKAPRTVCMTKQAATSPLPTKQKYSMRWLQSNATKSKILAFKIRLGQSLNNTFSYLLHPIWKQGLAYQKSVGLTSSFTEVACSFRCSSATQTSQVAKILNRILRNRFTTFIVSA